jgi:Cu/Ag efflux protein CusF
MKNLIKIFIVLTFLSAFFAFACSSENESDSDINQAQKVDEQTYKSVGVVKKVDAEKGEITVDHEDIPGYMSAMEMTEPVADKKMLDSIKNGDKVEFEIERAGADVTFIKLNKVGEVAVSNSSEIFKANCAECHGASGEGAKKGIPLISGHALHHSEKEFIKQVKTGEDKKMPAFKDRLSEEEIKAVVKFVREDLQKNSSKKEKHEHQH